MKSDTGERNNEELSKELRELILRKQKELSTEEGKLLGKVNADCLPGYVCIYGQCVKKIV